MKYVSTPQDLVMFGSSIHMVDTQQVDTLIVDDFSSFFASSGDGTVLDTISILSHAASFMNANLLIGLVDTNVCISHDDGGSIPNKNNIIAPASSCQRIIKNFTSQIFISRMNTTTKKVELYKDTRRLSGTIKKTTFQCNYLK